MPKAPQTIFEDPIVNFAGFGLGGGQGEYFYSQGMTQGPNGIIPGWNVSESTDSTALTGLGIVNWFGRQKVTGGDFTYALDQNNNLYRTSTGAGSWSRVYIPTVAGAGQGMLVDQLNQVLIAGTEYLSMYDGVTAPFTTGTVGVTNGSTNVAATGSQTFTSAMVGKAFFVTGDSKSYLITAQTSTNLTLATPYTGTTNASAGYSIAMGGTDQFQNFGTSYTGLCPMDMYEDIVAIGRGNVIANYFASDGSFQPNGLNLPTGYTVSAIKNGRTGLLIGVNTGSRGAVFLWDGEADGSIAPWIWFNSNVQALITINEGGYSGGWYVFTTRGIYFTDGYQTKDIYTKFPDSYLNVQPFFQTLLPQGVDYISNKLFFMAGTGTNRQRAGVYILDLTSNLFEFAPVANGNQLGVNSGAVYFDGTESVWLSYQTTTPSSKNFLSTLQNTPPTQAYFITEPKGQGGNVKVADAAKFTITPDVKFVASSPQMSFNLSLKVYDFSRPLLTTQVTSQVAPNTYSVIVNGTSVTGTEVGDEVTVLEGVNAGCIRHITAITNQGTSTETWTLDGNAMNNNTEAGVYVVSSPFLLVRRFEFSYITTLRNTYFDIESKYRGKKFLLKLLLEYMSNAPLEISEGQFFYRDLGIAAQ